MKRYLSLEWGAFLKKPCLVLHSFHWYINKNVYDETCFCVKPWTSSHFTVNFIANKQAFYLWLFSELTFLDICPLWYKAIEFIEFNCFSKYIENIKQKQRRFYVYKLFTSFCTELLWNLFPVSIVKLQREPKCQHSEHIVLVHSKKVNHRTKIIGQTTHRLGKVVMGYVRGVDSSNEGKPDKKHRSAPKRIWVPWVELKFSAISFHMRQRLIKVVCDEKFNNMKEIQYFKKYLFCSIKPLFIRLFLG